MSYGQRLAGSRHIIEERQFQQSCEKPHTVSQERRDAVSHGDSILHLKMLQTSGERLLLSASADGVVKAWK